MIITFAEHWSKHSNTKGYIPILSEYFNHELSEMNVTRLSWWVKDYWALPDVSELYDILNIVYKVEGISLIKFMQDIIPTRLDRTMELLLETNKHYLFDHLSEKDKKLCNLMK